MAAHTSRRWFLLGSAVLSGTVLIQACARGAPSTPPSATPAPSQMPASKPSGPTASPTPAIRQAAKGRPTVLTYYTVQGGQAFLGFGEILDAFEQRQDKIGVELVFTPATAGAAENPKLITSLAAGQAPDISWIGDFTIPQWQQLGYITDLRSYFQRDKLSLDSFWPCLRPTMGYKGLITYMPIQINPVMPTFWNKALFKEAGLNPEEGPRTISDLDRIQAALTKKDSNGNVTTIGIIPWDFSYTPGNAAVTWGFCFGGQFTDEALTKVTATHPAVIEAFEWVAGHAKRIGGPEKVAVTVPSLSVHRFGQGHIGIDGLVTASLTQILNYKKDFPYGVGNLPHKEGTPENPSWGGGWCQFVPKGAKHVDAAWEFLRWIGAEDDGTMLFWNKTTQFTGRMDLPWTQKAKADPLYKPFIEMLEVTRNTRPLIPVSNFYYTELNTAMQDVAYGRKTAKQALEDVQRNVTKEWDRFNQENG